MIYFIRHGLTDWNEHINEKGVKSPKCQGRANIPLNQNGINQAHEAAKQLCGIKFDKVFCSPLTRAKQTCEIILGNLDNVIIDERIIERDFGEFEGLTKDEFDFLDFCNNTHKNKYKAETIQSIHDRVFEFLDELKQYADENILIVSHGGVGGMFLKYFDDKHKDNDTHFIVPHGEPIIRSF